MEDLFKLTSDEDNLTSENGKTNPQEMYTLKDAVASEIPKNGH